MTEYWIAGNEVQISTEVENERYVRNSTASLISDIGSIFDTWYDSQSNCVAVNRNAGTLIGKTIGPLVTKAVQMLSDQGIYSIDENLFVSKYLSGYDDKFYDTLDNMMDRIAEIDEQLASEQRYREVRKASRGRVVGGGFGLGGALKGMATAGVMNATTGMVHSIGNAVGNMGSSMSASSNKAAVYKNAKALLREAIINCGYYVRNGIRNALEKEANIRCKYVTTAESNQAKAILQNYTQGRIPQEQRKSQIIQALVLNPYSTEIYETIWNDYGDKNGDLRKMSSYFGCGLQQQIQMIASKYGEDVFSASCGEYTKAFDKKKSIIRLEANIKDSLKKMELYCGEHDIEESLIPKINLCRELLEKADLENRSVNGVIYSTREIANRVKADYHRFYKNCEGRDLTDDIQFRELCNQTYVSNEFNEIAKAVCEKEKMRRTPEKIFDNVWDILISNLDESTLGSIGVNVAGRFGIFSQHENVVRTITGMPADEIPLMVIERSNNGKSGMMVTDKFLRIYSKGLLSSENKFFGITKIRSFECIGSDQFVIAIDQEKPIDISFKIKNVSDEKQILFANTVSEVICMVATLYAPHRQNLYRILNGHATCTCGTKLLSSEKICPSCGKMMRENGEFVDTEYCPSCGSLVQKGKKFCSCCGALLIVNQQAAHDLNTEISDVITGLSNEIKNDCDIDDVQNNKKAKVSINQSKSNEEISSDVKYCPICGNEIRLGKKFCSQCGTKIN